MKQLYIALLLHSILSIQSLQAQGVPETDSLMSHIRHAMHFNRVVPQEKVYLHLDNMGYFENEQIWFKAYLTRTDTGSPSNKKGWGSYIVLHPGGSIRNLEFPVGKKLPL